MSDFKLPHGKLFHYEVDNLCCYATNIAKIHFKYVKPLLPKMARRPSLELELEWELNSQNYAGSGARAIARPIGELYSE